MKYILGLIVLASSITAASEELNITDPSYPFGSNWKPEKQEGYVERDLVSVISEISLSVGYHFDKECNSAIEERILVRNQNVPAIKHIRDIAKQLPDTLTIEINMMKSLIAIDARDSILQFDCSESL
jgi:hypothetical protein